MSSPRAAAVDSAAASSPRDDGSREPSPTADAHTRDDIPSRDRTPHLSSPSANHTDEALPSTDIATTAAEDGVVAVASVNEWQAIWSPTHNAYYFFNSLTDETTWLNPLEPPAAEPEHEASSSSVVAPSHDPEAAAIAAGIDPALAYLDPSLAYAPGPGGGSMAFTAKFNARSGAFTRADGRDPDHMSEYERAKRMSEFYFDVNAWEQEVAQRKALEAQEEADGTKKRKKVTKKDLERFKEQRKRKMIAKTAWLRT